VAGSCGHGNEPVLTEMDSLSVGGVFSEEEVISVWRFTLHLNFLEGMLHYFSGLLYTPISPSLSVNLGHMQRNYY
jgi:hypothetical protein